MLPQFGGNDAQGAWAHLIRTVVASALALPLAVQGQTPLLFRTGYSVERPKGIAPGEILNLFVTGANSNDSLPLLAHGPSLPRELGGVSVLLRTDASSRPAKIPILSIRRVTPCVLDAVKTCIAYVAVSVQIPYEIPTNIPGRARPPLFGRLSVIVGGVASKELEVDPVPDHIHIRNGCDIDTDRRSACEPLALVMHKNGDLISATKPAEPGEEISIMAYGLGATLPPASTGVDAPASPARVQQRMHLVTDFRPNAPPWNAYSAGVAACEGERPECSISIVDGELTPGAVGEYQVHLIVPTPPSGTSPCAASKAPSGRGPSSNVTFTIVGLSSYDGAAICVAIRPGDRHP